MLENEKMNRRTMLATGGAALLTACATNGSVVAQGAQNQGTASPNRESAGLPSLDAELPR